jgi:hypothetical protein
MKRINLAIAVIAAAAMTVAISSGASADGGGPKAKTKIDFTDLGTNGSKGTLSSKKNFCLKNRKVSLFRVEDFVSDKEEIVYSNAKGKWKTKHQLEPGDYFAKVDAENINGVECLYAVTKTKTFH